MGWLPLDYYVRCQTAPVSSNCQAICIFSWHLDLDFKYFGIRAVMAWLEEQSVQRGPSNDFSSQAPWTCKLINKTNFPSMLFSLKLLVDCDLSLMNVKHAFFRG